MRAIYFDMDGTLANFYGVPNWLNYLVDANPHPYAVAEPLVDVEEFVRLINKLKAKGWKIGIITWLAKNSKRTFNKKVAVVKKEWLNDTFGKIFDEIIITTYGLPKNNFGDIEDILFDDEKQNRDNWFGTAYDEKNIIEVLKKLDKIRKV